MEAYTREAEMNSALTNENVGDVYCFAAFRDRLRTLQELKTNQESMKKRTNCQPKPCMPACFCSAQKIKLYGVLQISGAGLHFRI